MEQRVWGGTSRAPRAAVNVEAEATSKSSSVLRRGDGLIESGGPGEADAGGREAAEVVVFQISSARSGAKASAAPEEAVGGAGGARGGGGPDAATGRPNDRPKEIDSALSDSAKAGSAAPRPAAAEAETEGSVEGVALKRADEGRGLRTSSGLR